jgi:hypothetical protein
VAHRGRGVRQNPGLRDWLAAYQLPYVLAIRNDDLLVCPARHREQGKVLATLAGVDAGGRIDPAAWERRSLGYGAHRELAVWKHSSIAQRVPATRISSRSGIAAGPAQQQYARSGAASPSPGSVCWRTNSQ